MKLKSLNPFSLILVSISISLLILFYYFNSTPIEVKGEISNYIGQKVLAKGKISSMKIREGFALIEISVDGNEIPVFITRYHVEKVKWLRKEQVICVIGVVKEYQGKPEIYVGYFGGIEIC